ncbi:MAG: metal ABC transporter permease [Bacteroidales bacterium]|nr:metal ABC transporter permease [Bacteroidales bacterium]
MPNDIALSLLTDSAVRTVALGAAAVGAVSGAIGAFAVVRQQSLQGDAISHAALPGIALAFLFGGRSELTLILGAAVAGWLAMVCVNVIIRGSRIPFDAALAGVLAVFFGFGLAVMSYLQKHVPDAAGHGLERYLFGQAAFIRTADVLTVVGLGGAALLVLILGWKEFKLISFDPDFAASLGYSPRWWDLILTTLIVLAVVMGLQTVGVVLMSTLIVAPAVAARMWTNRLERLVALASLLGAGAGCGGTFLSLLLERLFGRAVPPGPVIVLVASLAVVISLGHAPVRSVWTRKTAREAVP